MINIEGVAYPASRWQMDSLVPGGFRLEGGAGLGGGGGCPCLEYWTLVPLGSSQKTLHRKIEDIHGVNNNFALDWYVPGILEFAGGSV